MDKALQQAAHARSDGKLEIESLGGHKRTLLVSFVPVAHDESGSFVGMVATEVTRFEETSKALKDSEASLRCLSARLLLLQDEERRHLARDLHDTIGQELAVAVMRVEKIANGVGEETDLRKSLTECGEWLRKVESETRTLSYVLHPPLLDQIGLVPALKWYIEGFSKRSGLDVHLHVAGKIPRLAVEQETALFRIVQESLTNVLRHSGSPEAHVRVEVEGKDVRVSIEDKGRGLNKRQDLEGAKAEVGGVGIPGMRSRLSLVQGTLDIRSSERGTTISAMVALDDAQKDRDETMVRLDAGRPAPSQCVTAPVPARSVARILVADDHEIARRGIRDLFRDEPDFEICGEASDGVEALSGVEELHPDLLILDLSMPKMGGFSVANHLRTAQKSVKILIYSNHSHSDIERMARSSGCCGCVHKANAARDLVRGARAILRGGTFFASEATAAKAV